MMEPSSNSKDMMIEVDCKTNTRVVPGDESLCVVVFQETKLSQRMPKSAITAFTAWKVFDLPSNSHVFKFPAATGLEAEILLPESAKPVVISRTNVKPGSKWILVETSPDRGTDDSTGEGRPSTVVVLREAAIPTKPYKQPPERIPKDAIVIENQLADCSDDGPTLQQLSITKGGCPIQIVPSHYTVPGTPVTFSLNPILHFGVGYNLVQGDTYYRKMNLLSRYTVTLEDFPYGLRIEVNKGAAAGSFFFTGHSKPSLSSMEEDQEYSSDLPNGEAEYGVKSNGKAVSGMAEEVSKHLNHRP